MSGHQATDDCRTGLLEEMLFLMPMTSALVGCSAVAHDRLASNQKHTPGSTELAVRAAVPASKTADREGGVTGGTSPNRQGT